MQNVGKSLGMEIHPPLPPESMPAPTRNTRQLMEFFTSMKNKVQLVVVVVPDKGDCYGEGLSIYQITLCF
jgi:hypothetical protein